MTAGSAQVRPDVRPDPGRQVRGLDAGQRRERRTQLIVDAALTLFAEQGYWATSVEQIAARARVSTKSFYGIFENKLDCFGRMLVQITERIEAGLTLPRHAGAGEADAVAALMESLVHTLVIDPRLAKILLERPGPDSRDTDLQYRSVWQPVVRALDAVLQGVDGLDGRARRPSPKPRLHPHKVALGFVGGVRELIADWLQEAPIGDTDAAQQLACDLALYYECVRGDLARGVGARSSGYPLVRGNEAVSNLAAGPGNQGVQDG